MLSRLGMGMGTMALGELMGPGAAQAAGVDGINPFGVRRPHHEPKAKRVIHFFMNGGPSQVDTFDPKPELTKYDGKPLPSLLKTERPTGAGLKSPFAFKKYGQCGLEVVTSLPRLLHLPTTSASYAPCTPTCRTMSLPSAS